MSLEPIKKYQSIKDLHTEIGFQIKSIKKQIDEYSKLIGDKMRSNEDEINNDTQLIELKEAMEGKDEDPKNKDKKKKKMPRKNRKNNGKWFDLNGVCIYNGIGVQGELELYFKAIDDMKLKLQNLNTVKESLQSIIQKGVKSDLSCITLANPNLPYEVAFITTNLNRKRFSFNSIIKTTTGIGETQ